MYLAATGSGILENTSVEEKTIPKKFLQPDVPSMQLPLQLCELKGKLIPDFFVSK
jgi:hypothetical protein